MKKGYSLFIEKFKVPEKLRVYLHSIVTDEEVILLNYLAKGEKKESVILSKFPFIKLSLLESLYRKGYLIREFKKSEQYYESSTFNQIIKRFVNHNPLFPKLQDKDQIIFQEYIMDRSLEEMKASEKPVYRVIPVEQTIEDKRQLTPYHQARHYLLGASALAVVNCLCRTTFNRCDKPREVCLALGEKAEFFIKRRIGKEIDVQRGLKILEEARNAGLVHSINDQENPEYLCNCCECCCFFVQGLQKYGVYTSMGRSGFIAQVDLQLCNQCGICVEKCLFGAISLDDEGIKFDDSRCFGCGLCAYHCPQEAVQLILNEEKKDF